MPGRIPFFLAVSELRGTGAVPTNIAMEGVELGSLGCLLSPSGNKSARSIHRRRAPNRTMSGAPYPRIDLELASPAGAAVSGTSFREMSRPPPPSARSSSTASGGPFRATCRVVSSPSSRSCDIEVILKNHWVRSRCSTSAPERQPPCRRSPARWRGTRHVDGGVAQFDLGVAPLDQPAFPEIEEQPLLMAG